ncbi:glycosyltransferase family 4 protein [Curtobacterium sp. MCBD17_032]|uniref:glycosyltransferase family 4 protein n=1 Tax=Curtobacterium sp. MCBD17_032 TaxID=2175659 RepID=UPI000DA75B69|nr:glycosyltransferase family 4 protein [Curtobacterium sp. MCBD17_032]PZE86281.1 hypothetical protein DEI91_04040 [Curtobacterium sp. MCBD17_032]
MPNLRVLHILGELRPSGMERMLVSGAADFKASGVAAHVAGFGVQHPYATEIRLAGYGVSTTEQPLRSAAGRRFLARVIADFRPDVVHLHSEGNYLQNVLTIRRIERAVPIVRTVHNVFTARGKWFVSRFLQAVVADRFVRAVIVPSHDVASNEERFARRVKVVYNWVDPRYFALTGAHPNDDPHDLSAPVVLVGNCSWIKNHDVVLEAALMGGLRVAHVGSEDHAEPSELRLLEELEKRGLLVSRGARDPITTLVGGRVFAMPSVNEGMPVALAEALVVGLPAVVADAPGLRWAASQPGVTMVSSREPAVWLESLRRASRGTQALTVDFRPARGTAEYVEIYRAAVVRNGGTK